jgi:putative ABC transport system permease protein
MIGLLQDLRYALRQLRKSPGFTAVAIVTLALGIGANTAIYSLLDQVLLRSLPVRDPNRLVQLRFAGSDTGRVNVYGGDAHDYFSYPMYRDVRDQNSVFRGVLATDSVQVGVQWHNQPELVSGELVSGNYFDVLGVAPGLGRLFVPSDDQVQEANPVVVLSFGYWKRRFGSDPHILDQSIQINGHPFTVIGVTPPGFRSVVGGNAPDVFAPMMMKPQVTPGWNDLDNRRSRWLNIIGRLKPGVSLQQAEAGINPLWHSLRTEELKSIPARSEQFRQRFVEKSSLTLLDAAKGFSPLRDDIRVPLLIIMGMVGLVALMACANVGSLLLVRAAGRVREMSIRYALGAKRTQVARQLLVEGLLLGLAGGVIGVLLAPQASAILARMLVGPMGDLPFTTNPDLRILMFSLVLSLGVSVVFSLAPAAQFWRPNLAPALKQQTMTASGGALRFRRISVAAQIGLSLLLLLGAGLFVRTLRNLKSLNVGFATDHLVTFGIDPRLAGHKPDQASALYKQILEKLRALPGVRAVAATDDPELAGNDNTRNITVAGYTSKDNEDMVVEWPSVTPNYFSALEMPLVAGRGLSEQDASGTAKVAVVNETFVRHFYASPQQAIGRYIGPSAQKDAKTDVQIVGVVRDARHMKVRDDVRQAVFNSYLQGPDPFSMAFYVRTWQAPQAAEEMVRQALQTLDPNLVLDGLRTMDEQIDENLTAERMIALLASSFAILAALMAGVGLYGVLAYSTAQRTKEIGIRMALGGSRGTVVRMVLVEVLWLAGVSVAIALPLSLLLAHAVRSQLFGISSNDPLTLGVTTALVAGVAFVSALIPAWRAARVDPLVALRYE